jgi:quercetin 2,3-dioxygenase
VAEDRKLPPPRSLLVTARERAALPERIFRHPENPASEVHLVDLGRRAGLRRVGVVVARLPPGRESFAFHVHHGEEECLFVLSGRGVIRVGPEELPLGPGDLAGFPPQGHPHVVRNTGTEDLVCLNVGEALGNEVVDFPEAGKQLVRRKGEARIYPLAAGAVIARTEKPPPPLPPPASCRVAAGARGEEAVIRHPLNPGSELHGWLLSRRVGLARVGLNLGRLAPGKESFIFHLHHVEEEFAWILSGRGLAEIGGETFEVGPGDFLGFPPGTHGHNLRAVGDEGLEYLSGGESREVEIGDFPRIGKRLLRVGPEASVVPLAGTPLFPAE